MAETIVRLNFPETQLSIKLLYRPDSEAVKHTVDDLAIFSGHSSFAEKLHVGRPNIGNRDRLLARLNDILDRRWLTNNGFYVQEFERRVAEIVGVKHCIAMCNATVALEIAERALDLSGEVIVPSLTFVATAHSLQWQNITPVFCDVDPETLTIDPARIEELITPRTTGIIGVHLFGRPCNINALANISRRRNLKLMFDAAHAFGCTYHGQMIGGFGEVEVFSFHATKFLNSLEGGAVLTNSDELARKMRFMQNFGFAGYDNVQYVGTNGKMNEFSAAMGITSLESMSVVVEANCQNHQAYREALAGTPGLKMRGFDENEKSNYQYVVLEVDDGQTGISRDHIVECLHAENVIARRYFYPGCHRLEPYRSYFPNSHLLLPVTERVTKQLLSLPTGTSVSLSEVKQVSELVRFIAANGAEINRRIETIAKGR